MITLLSQMSDDQMALAGCGGALLAAFTVMAVSYHVGRLVRREPGRAESTRPVDAGLRAHPVGARIAERRAA